MEGDLRDQSRFQAEKLISLLQADRNFYLYDCTRRPKDDPGAVSVPPNVSLESRVETMQAWMQSRKEFLRV